MGGCQRGPLWRSKLGDLPPHATMLQGPPAEQSGSRTARHGSAGVPRLLLDVLGVLTGTLGGYILAPGTNVLLGLSELQSSVALTTLLLDGGNHSIRHHRPCGGRVKPPAGCGDWQEGYAELHADILAGRCLGC